MSIQDTILIRWMMKTLNLNHKFKLILFYGFLFLPLTACTNSKTIRVHNISKKKLEKVNIAGKNVGDINPGAKSDYVNVFLFFNYAVIKMTIDGIYVNSQSLNFWSDTLTHEIKIKNLQDRHLSVKVIRH